MKTIFYLCMLVQIKKVISILLTDEIKNKMIIHGKRIQAKNSSEKHG